MKAPTSRKAEKRRTAGLCGRTGAKTPAVLYLVLLSNRQILSPSRLPSAVKAGPNGAWSPLGAGMLLGPQKPHTAAYTGLSGVAAVGAITTLGARCVLLKRWTAREQEGVLCRFTRSAHRLPEQTERPVF